MSKINILWVNDNPQVAEKMVFMYATNSKKAVWWDEVEIIVWGPTAKLIAENEMVQGLIKTAQDEGVSILACKSCADSFGVSDKLLSLGIEVKYMGVPLTDLIKADEKLITV